MSSGKSNIVSVILDAIPEVPPDECHVPYASIISSRNDASTKFDWSRFMREKPTNKKQRAFKTSSVIYNLIDGSQILRSSMPNDQTIKSGTAKWYYVKNNALRIVQGIIDDIDSVKHHYVENHHTIFGVDNSKHVCLAKKPTQNARRLDKINGEDIVRKDGSVKKKDYIVLPTESADDFSIEDGANIPRDWDKISICPGFMAKSTEYILNALRAKDAIVTDKTSMSKNFGIWCKGEMEFVNYDPSFAAVYANKFEMMGEFDYFFIRYIITMVEYHYRENIEDKFERVAQLDSLTLPVNFNMFIFRIFSSDTDILLHSLYLLEHLHTKYKMPPTDLPKIIMVSTISTGRTINVTYLYLSLRYEIEKIYTGVVETSVRSLMMAFHSWGGDLMPSTHFVTAEYFFRAFMKYRPLMGGALLSLNELDPEPAYKSRCVMNGKAFRMLFALAYAEKHLQDKDKIEMWKYAGMSGGGETDTSALESFIIRVISLKKIEEKKKIPVDSVTHQKRLEARLTVTNIMMYGIEHALGSFPTSYTHPLSALTMPPNCYDNVYDEYLARVDQAKHERAVKLGIISTRSGWYCSSLLDPNGIKCKVTKLLADVKKVSECFYFGEADFAATSSSGVSNSHITFEALMDDFEMQ